VLSACDNIPSKEENQKEKKKNLAAFWINIHKKSAHKWEIEKFREQQQLGIYIKMLLLIYPTAVCCCSRKKKKKKTTRILMGGKVCPPSQQKSPPSYRLIISLLRIKKRRK
jgi:hypothetical protein